jgi:formylglycine-generating enzyme required for sulfatase activity
VKFDLPRLTNWIGMELALIPPGAFLMGSPPDEAWHSDDEQQHEVEIMRAFGLGAHPVTVGQFRAFAQATGYGQTDWQAPGFPQDDSHPVVNVSWQDAQAFGAWLTQTESGRVYRLPSEAEWEYACRAGAPEAYPVHVGEPLHSLSSTQANFNGKGPYGGAAKGPALRRTTPVGSYPPNAWGLFDLHGNVCEWCADRYGEEYYPQSPRQDPPGPPEGSLRVIRGGGWRSAGQYCRSAFRDTDVPSDWDDALGFRVALVLSGG